MRVLFVVSDCSFPPQEGLHQQTLLLVTALAGAGCEVVMTGYTRSPTTEAQAVVGPDVTVDVQQIAPRRTLLGLAVANRLGLGRWVEPKADRTIRDHLRRGGFDVVHLDGVAACCLFRPDWSVPAVLSFVDPGSRRQLRMARTQRGLLRRGRALTASVVYFLVERSLAHQGTAWHVVSPGDRDYLASVHRHEPTRSIPVLLPAGFTGPTDSTRSNPPPAGRTRVVVLADLRLPHMRAAFEHLVAHDLRSDPRIADESEFVVVGRVSADAALRELVDGLHVEFSSWVEDYEAAMRDADVVLLPDLVGTGLKNRAVQALASGTPTIGTSVAFEGIPVEHGVHALVGDGERSIGSLLASLLGQVPDPVMGTAARDLVASRYSGLTVVPVWLALYREAAKGSRTPAGQPGGRMRRRRRRRR